MITQNLTIWNDESDGDLIWCRHCRSNVRRDEWTQYEECCDACADESGDEQAAP